MIPNIFYYVHFWSCVTKTIKLFQIKVSLSYYYYHYYPFLRMSTNWNIIQCKINADTKLFCGPLNEFKLYNECTITRWLNYVCRIYLSEYILSFRNRWSKKKLNRHLIRKLLWIVSVLLRPFAANVTSGAFYLGFSLDKK